MFNLWVYSRLRLMNIYTSGELSDIGLGRKILWSCRTNIDLTNVQDQSKSTMKTNFWLRCWKYQENVMFVGIVSSHEEYIFDLFVCNLCYNYTLPQGSTSHWILIQFQFSLTRPVCFIEHGVPVTNWKKYTKCCKMEKYSSVTSKVDEMEVNLSCGK